MLDRDFGGLCEASRWILTSWALTLVPESLFFYYLLIFFLLLIDVNWVIKLQRVSAFHMIIKRQRVYLCISRLLFHVGTKFTSHAVIHTLQLKVIDQSSPTWAREVGNANGLARAICLREKNGAHPLVILTWRVSIIYRKILYSSTDLSNCTKPSRLRAAPIVSSRCELHMTCKIRWEIGFVSPKKRELEGTISRDKNFGHKHARS